MVEEYFIIGKSRCVICGVEKELSNQEFMILLANCQTIPAVKSFIMSVQSSPDIILNIECKNCLQKYDFERQKW